MLIWLIEKILGIFSLFTYWRARRMFENDPELQAINKRLYANIEKSSRMVKEYCDKYGCVEPTENTIVLEKLRDMKASGRSAKHRK